MAAFPRGGFSAWRCGSQIMLCTLCWRCGVVSLHRGGTWLMSLLDLSAPKQALLGVIGGVVYPSATPDMPPMLLWGVLQTSACFEVVESSAGGEGRFLLSLRLMAAC